jgi:peptide chain release factor
MTSWIQISAGRGPVECCWVVAQMAAFLNNQASEFNCKTSILEITPGPMKDTYRSVLMAIDGNNVMIFLRQYQGTTQWIGKSMFRPEHKRKNWFVDIKAYSPVKHLELDMTKIHVERMRASGPGGQHVNKTESAVRLTHIPSGLSAVAQEERSQHLNKSLALVRLRELLQNKEDIKMKRAIQQRWAQHNELQRGNATHVFTGKKFELKNR